jgi:hypothetical protein
MIGKSTKHEREFYDIAFDIVYTKDENIRRVALSNLLHFILPTIRQAHQELNHYLIEEDNRDKRARGQQTPAPTTGMDMLEKLDRYIESFNTEVELYERTRGGK